PRHRLLFKEITEPKDAETRNAGGFRRFSGGALFLGGHRARLHVIGHQGLQAETARGENSKRQDGPNPASPRGRRGWIERIVSAWGAVLVGHRGASPRS